MEARAFNVCAQADRAASAAASRAGVTLEDVEAMPDLLDVSRLLEAVWGRSAEGVPLNSEVLRSLVHAGGAVTVARRQDGVLAGAAALVLADADATYSLIAAAAPGTGDRGIGQALKLHQRAWALRRGRTSMRWTFDPLVSRNARFNLTKLGAVAGELEPAFYGRMSDAINGDDDADRLVASWRLDGTRALSASEGTAAEPVGPPLADAEVLAPGPDGGSAYVADGTLRWCRVPGDIVALRRTRPDQASRWRAVVRAAVTDALGSGLHATGLTRDGWYCFTPREDR